MNMDDIWDTYPFNTFHGATKEELVDAALVSMTRARIDELENLPPYIHDAFPSIRNRIKNLRERLES